MEQKYYWYSFVLKGRKFPFRNIFYIDNLVTKDHPLVLFGQLKQEKGTLLNWKEITREEYYLFISK